jgi:hypothetical protein
MPANCSADVEAVVGLFDTLAGNATAFDSLKAEFGMQDVQHVDDVTAARTSLPFRARTLSVLK